MLVDAFLETAARRAGKLAVRDVQRELTYEQLAILSAALSRVIARQTQQPSVGILLPSTAGFVGSFYGSLWAGKSIVPLNFLLQPRELRHVVQDSGIDLILTCEFFRDLAAQLPARALFLEQIGLRRRYLLSRVLPFPRVPRTGPDDLAVILYTSGTTGVPRGVCLSHNNLYSNAVGAIRHAQMHEDQRFLGVIPLFHTFGLTAMMIVPTLLGSTVYYHARFQPAQVLQALRDDSISIFMAIASMFAAIGRVKTASPEYFRPDLLAISGGEPLAPAVFQDFRDRLGLIIQEGYGLTETSPIVSFNNPRASRPGTVGTPIPDVTVQARDDNGLPLPPGQRGEICVRGPNVTRGYYKRPADTAAAIDADGWLRTGDLGTVDADGFISITGRKKDMIIVGGENVFPREIETVLDAHPGVAESAVIGVPDPSRGEVVVAFVVPTPDARLTPIELREYCREHLAGYKIPRQVIIEPDLPRGPTGKVLKRALRERMGAVPSDRRAPMLSDAGHR